MFAVQGVGPRDFECDADWFHNEIYDFGVATLAPDRRRIAGLAARLRFLGRGVPWRCGRLGPRLGVYSR
ncbi:MAG: DUF6183 family protein [Streptomyces sp.]|uniref:DUF6183 family protein n=1 Tax=Streptomyces sp. TaxID=1931 RepID=UPI003D6BF87D